MQYNNSCFRPNEANGFLHFYLFCQLRRKCSFIGKDVATNFSRGEILAPRRSPNLPFGSAECRTHRSISIIKTTLYADVAKLADAHDSGSCGKPCRFKSCHPHHKKARCEAQTNRVRNASLFFIAPFCFAFLFLH